MGIFSMKHGKRDLGNEIQDQDFKLNKWHSKCNRLLFGPQNTARARSFSEGGRGEKKAKRLNAECAPGFQRQICRLEYGHNWVFGAQKTVEITCWVTGGEVPGFPTSYLPVRTRHTRRRLEPSAVLADKKSSTNEASFTKYMPFPWRRVSGEGGRARETEGACV